MSPGLWVSFSWHSSLSGGLTRLLHGTSVLGFEVSGSPVWGQMSWDLRGRGESDISKEFTKNFSLALLQVKKKKKLDLGPKLDSMIVFLKNYKLSEMVWETL